MGQGLNAKGIKLLSQKLANLTIGDLEALLDLKNMDSSQVSLLLSQLKDLAKALVNRTCHLCVQGFFTHFVFVPFTFVISGQF